MFALQYRGNLLPFELAQQRFAHEFATTNRIATDPAFAWQRGNWRFLSPWGHCHISTMVLAGALRDGEEPAFVDAVMLPGIPRQLGPSSNYCGELEAIAGGAELEERLEKPRYSWGSKALYAIALSHASVTTIHRSIRFATWGAYALLAGALFLAGWRVFAVAAPILLFGLFFSGVRWMSDVTNGIPYAWAIFTGAGFAWLVAGARRLPASALRLFCFVAGMASSWFWAFEGHELIIVLLIGLIGWFGLPHLEPRIRFFRVSGFIALYIVGFVACFSLVQLTKMLTMEMYGNRQDFVTRSLFEGGFQKYLLRMWEELSAGFTDWRKLPLIEDWRPFRRMSPLGYTATWALLALSLLALPVAAALAWLRGRGSALRTDLLWLAGLLLVVIVHFVLPDDQPFRRARYLAFFLGLSWSCLIVAGLNAGPRHRPWKRNGNHP